ncbi:MAG: hypothetical protein K9G70_06310 [Prolixibacteraceae bacterium]|nr:hypothetical protein [Prolixibacteraceae bacterium]
MNRLAENIYICGHKRQVGGIGRPAFAKAPAGGTRLREVTKAECQQAEK